MCVFHKKDYIQLLKMLIYSIFIKGSIDKEKTNILIFTCNDFYEEIVKELIHFDLPINYYILEYTTFFEACRARLDIFSYKNIDNYEKILYLDTDVLINSDMNILFNLTISIDKLYALEEGTIGHRYWGHNFFDLSKYDPKITGFSSGVLYFYNSQIIKDLFQKIKYHITDYIYDKNNVIPDCLDQPFIVYNSFIENKYDNQFMKEYIENNPKNIDKKKIIYHFQGGVGDYYTKFNKMIFFWNKMNQLNN
jgi:lipopolysaccharide biosynthesis glycosyltransferase